MYYTTLRSYIIPAVAYGFPEYRVKLLRVLDEGADIRSFYFGRPPGFEYRPGQAVFVMPVEGDPYNVSREMSLASAPGEDFLILTMRTASGSSFKKAMLALSPGDEITIEGAYGEFTLPAETGAPLVFIAGGIGVTPFRAMIAHSALENLPFDFRLFYSVKSPDEIAYENEWPIFSHTLGERFEFFPTISRKENVPAGWNGETGRIDIPMLTRKLGGLDGMLFYVCGTPAMARESSEALHAAGVAKENVRMESFSGY